MKYYRNKDEQRIEYLQEMLKREEKGLELCNKRARRGLKGMLVFAGLLVGGLVLSYMLPDIQNEDVLHMAKIASMSLAIGGSAGGLSSAFSYYKNKNEGIFHRAIIADIKNRLSCPKAEEIFEDDFAR